MARSGPRKSGRYQRDQRIAATGTVVLLVITVALSAWMYQKTSTAQRDSPDSAATAPPSAPTSAVRVQLRAWLTQSEPLINALVIARNNIAAAAAERDIPGTGAACQTASGAVADLHRQLPSPEPTLNSTFQQAISSYKLGLPYCIGTTHVQEGSGLQQAATFITQGDTAMRAALDFLGHVPGCEPRDVGMLIV
jgi:hypothetical protein